MKKSVEMCVEGTWTNGVTEAGIVNRAEGYGTKITK